MTAGTDEPEEETDETVPGEDGNTPDGAANGAETDPQWRFSVDEVGESGETDNGGNVAGSIVHEDPLEPEQINPENAVFFLIGSLGTILFVVLAVSGL